MYFSTTWGIIEEQQGFTEGNKKKGLWFIPLQSCLSIITTASFMMCVKIYWSEKNINDSFNFLLFLFSVTFQ